MDVTSLRFEPRSKLPAWWIWLPWICTETLSLDPGMSCKTVLAWTLCCRAVATTAGSKPYTSRFLINVTYRQNQPEGLRNALKSPIFSHFQEGCSNISYLLIWTSWGHWDVNLLNVTFLYDRCVSRKYKLVALVHSPQSSANIKRWYTHR